jgi:hypothetical protein
MIKPGRIIVDGDSGSLASSGSGLILFTDSTFFAFRSTSAMHKGGLFFGVVGALVGSQIDKKRAKNSPPEHLNHPEIISLDEKTKKSLMTTELVCSIPIDTGFEVKQNLLGYTFTAKGYPKVDFQGALHKKSIREYLQERGLLILS